MLLEYAGYIRKIKSVQQIIIYRDDKKPIRSLFEGAVEHSETEGVNVKPTNSLRHFLAKMPPPSMREGNWLSR